MYSIEFSKIAEKQFDKLEKSIQIRIVSRLERCRIRPYAYVKKLVASPYFSLRVGDYRVILNIIENKLIIFVIQLGHRRDIYQK
jgi:mRNA interferase RelE/StbE|tara:strand:- start:263 stop:514 length:252 start_codon:yes stop_codon:yes gene_type:complete